MDKTLNKLSKAYEGFNTALENAKHAIVDVLKENGGTIKTPPDDVYESGIEAIYFTDYDCEETKRVFVYAIIYDEDEGIGLLTGNGIVNYRYDNDLETDSDYTEFYDDVVADKSYYEFLNYGDFFEEQTIRNIIIGLLLLYI